MAEPIMMSDPATTTTAVPETYTKKQVQDIIDSLISHQKEGKTVHRPFRFWKTYKFFKFVTGMFVDWENKKIRKGIWLDLLLLFVIFFIFRVGIFMIKEMDAGHVVDLKVLFAFIGAIGTLTIQLISLQKAAKNGTTSTISSMMPGMNSMMPGMGMPGMNTGTNLLTGALSIVDTTLKRNSPSSPILDPKINVSDKVRAGDNR